MPREAERLRDGRAAAAPPGHRGRARARGDGARCRASCSCRRPSARRAYDDAALPIGRGQTISQPYMVARICEALALRGGERVLDVGTGSGYQAAVLAELARRGRDRRAPPGAGRAGAANLVAAGYERVEVRVGDGTLGVPERAPFDAIAVAAAAPELPRTLYEQLAPRGRLVVPVGGRGGQRLEVVVRSPEGPAVLRSVPCRFVPLVGEEGFPG